MTFLCNDVYPGDDDALACTSGRYHPGDHIAMDGLGDKVLATWPRKSLPMPLEIDGLPDSVIVTAMRMPFDPISHESWIIVSNGRDERVYSTHLVNWHAETGQYVATNGHYDIPNLTTATADAFDRWNRSF